MGSMSKVEETYFEKSKAQQLTKGRTHWQWIFAMIANLLLLTYGMQCGWVSPIMKILQSEDSPTGQPLTDNEISWVGSILTMAAAAGVPFHTFVADKYGRKLDIIICGMAQVLGWAIKFSSANLMVILTARILCGFASGGCFSVVPMYVREISQDDIRGLVGSLLIMFQNIGFLIMFGIGAYLGYFEMLWVVVWIPVLAVLLMIKAPESPAFLVKVGKVEEAAKTLAFLRCLSKEDQAVQREIDLMRKEELYFKSLPEISFTSIFKNEAWRKVFFLMLGLVSIHANNGSYAIVTYASSILSSSSSSAMNPELLSMSFPAVMILSAFASMSCVERFGRKPVLITSLTLLFTSMLCLASVILVQDKGGTVAACIPLLMMMISVAAYAYGLSPVPFIMLSEMFNFQIRAKALGFITTYIWAMCFVQLFIFGPLRNAIGLYGAFYFYSGINAIGLLLTILLLPETKGKTVEQIEAELRKK